MAIRIVFEEDVADRFDLEMPEGMERGLWRPRVFCDQCEGAIEEATEARFHYQAEPGAEQGLPFFTHGGCAADFLEERAGLWRSAPLSYFPIQLANALDNRETKRIFDLAPRPWVAEVELIGNPARRAAPVPADVERAGVAGEA